MALLDALLAGAKALIKEAASLAGEFIREVIREIDDTRIGRVLGKVAEGFLDRIDSRARDIAGEEAEILRKAERDGRLDQYSAQRLDEIRAERDKLRRELEEAKSQQAAEDLKSNAADLVSKNLDGDEVSANTDLVTSKECPDCGSTMRLRQGNIVAETKKRKFYWQCSQSLRNNCRTISYDPEKDKGSILRKANPDFDLDKKTRDSIWDRRDVSDKAHQRLRSHLGDDDDEVICPHHSIRMKLLPKGRPGGRMLDSYEYVCIGVELNGRACSHTVPVKSKPQVAEILRRKEGQGIIV
jgi:hypothetical protein